MKIRNKNRNKIKYDNIQELKKEGISLFDLMLKQMVNDGYINKEGKIEYPSD